MPPRAKKDFGEIKDPFEKARLRPDASIGDAKTRTKTEYVFTAPEVPEDGSAPSGAGTIALKEITYNRGLIHLAVEIMSNCMDNAWRSKEAGVAMSYIAIDVDVDPESETYGMLTFKNDGYHIPIEKHTYTRFDYHLQKEVSEEAYPADLFWGAWDTGTNFVDDANRKTSGKNGIGGKVVVAFSKHVIIDHTDPVNRKRYVREYRDGGKVRSPAKVTALPAKGKAYTSVSFIPDWEYFGYPNPEEPGIDEDFMSLLRRYVHECAMISGMKVTFQGERVIVKNLEAYVRLYYPDKQSHKTLHFTAPNGDECVLVEGEFPEHTSSDRPRQVSWVNGINTSQGGIHVDAWVDAIFPTLVREYNSRKKKKGGDQLKTTAKQLYPWFVIYVRAELPGALFEGNSKELLTGPPVDLLGVAETAAKQTEKTKLFRAMIGEHVQKILKWNFVSYVDEFLQAKLDASAKKADKPTAVAQSEKLDDAEDAGQGKGEECTLLITEGQSAQTMARRLIPTLEGGKRKWGVLPIRGKIANPAKKTLSEFSGNEEWKTIKAALGLVIGTDYSTPEARATLRYGRVMFFTDQDDDGLHIRALLLTIFVKLFRGLVTEDPKQTYAYALNTAVGMDIRKGKVIAKYYSNPEMEAAPVPKGAFRKYIKGTGSTSPQETASYTRDELKIVAYYLDDQGVERLMLVMSEKPEPRKAWIESEVIPRMGTQGEFKIEGDLGVREFVDTQLSIFAATALERGIPSIPDMLKVSQRQSLHGMLRYPFPKDQTVVIDSLGGIIKTDVDYHHGIVSLLGTIINMCQGFVGSNNLPPFVNGGECGSRLLNGKDAASPRYAMAAVEKVTRAIYRVEDEPVLRMRLSDDRRSYLEPYEFRPVIPPCNGAEGMAIGWSTNIPNLSPVKAVEWVKAWLAEVERPVMVPWYRGFTGPIRLMTSSYTAKGRLISRSEWTPASEAPPDSFESRGILRKVPSPRKNVAQAWEITELPIGLSTTKAKDFLAAMAATKTTPKGKVPPRISMVVDKSPNPDRVWFTFKETKDFTPDIDTRGNMDWLVRSHSLRNMVLLDTKGHPKRYESIDDILEEWCHHRYKVYETRRQWWLKRWTALKLRAANKLKTIGLVTDGKLNLRLPAEEVDLALAGYGVKKLKPIHDYTKPPPEEEPEASYDYVLSMQLRSMNAERIRELEKEISKYDELIEDYQSVDAGALWIRELDEFLEAYDQFLKVRRD